MKMNLPRRLLALLYILILKNASASERKEDENPTSSFNVVFNLDANVGSFEPQNLRNFEQNMVKISTEKEKNSRPNTGQKPSHPQQIKYLIMDIQKKLGEMEKILQEKDKDLEKMTTTLMEKTTTNVLIEESTQSYNDVWQFAKDHFKTDPDELYNILVHDAPCDLIVTIMNVATEVTGEVWNLKKFFDLEDDLTIMNSLTHHFYRDGYTNSLKEKIRVDGEGGVTKPNPECKGLEGFIVFSHEKKASDDLDATVQEYEPENQFKDDHSQAPTYYDPSEGVYHIVHHQYWFYRECFALFVSFYALKAFMNPYTMEWTFGDLSNFPTGRIFGLQLLYIFMHGMWLLGRIFISDSKTKITPPNEPKTKLQKVKRNSLVVMLNFCLTCWTVPGSIALYIVNINPLDAVPHMKGKQFKRALAKFFIMLFATISAYGIVILLAAATAFPIATWEISSPITSGEGSNHDYGLFTKFHEECGHLPLTGFFHPLPCWETLTNIVVPYWIPSTLEGWRHPILPLSNAGGLVWFVTGLALKFIKINFCEPILQFNAWETRKEFECFAKSQICKSCRALSALDLHKNTPTNAKYLKYFQGTSLALKSALLVGLGVVAGSTIIQLLAAVFFLQAVFFPSQTIPSRNITYKIITLGGLANAFFAFGAIVTYLMAWASQPGSTWTQGLSTPLGEAANLAYPVYVGPLVMIGNLLATTLQFTVTAVVVYVVQMKTKMLWHDKTMEHNYTHEHMNRISSFVYNSIFANEKYQLEPAEHEAQHEKRNFVPSIKGTLILAPGLIVSFLFVFVLMFSKSLNLFGEYQ